MQPRRLSIRDILWLTISALTLTITLLAGREVYLQWQQLEKIESLRTATLFSDKLFEATDKLSVERDIAFALLHASDPQDIADLRMRLKDSRAETDTAFGQALAVIRQYGFPELDALHKHVESRMASIDELRSQIDKAAMLPREQRENSLITRWHDEVTALITDTEDLWLQFIRHFTDINPIVTQHLRYKHFLLIISDYTGRERSLIGKLLVENANPTPEEIGQLLRWQGTIELSWKTAKLLADQSGLYTQIGPYFKDAESHYQTMYGMVRDIFYIPGNVHNLQYPISADLWFELSSEFLDSLNALKKTSQETKHAYLDGLVHAGQRAIALHIGILIFALALCGYCFWAISYRVLRPISAMIGALLDATQGKPTAFLPVNINMQDEIGKLANVLHAFQESGERYRALVEASSQIIWTWKPTDPSGMNVLMEWWEKTTGQPGSEMLPFGWLKVVHPDDQEYAKKIWEDVSATGNDYIMEYRIRARNGAYRWISVRGVGLKNPDGSIRELVGALNDITERKEGEKKLQAAHKFTDDMLNHIPDPIFMKDRQHRWIGGNKAFWEMMGGPSEHFLGKSDYEFFPKKEADIFWERDDKVLNSDEVDINEESFTDPHGQQHVFSTKKVAFLNEQGEKFLVGVIRDITDVKESEAKLMSYMGALERSNKELDDFAYIASHDLKEPLRGIHNHSRFLLEDNSDKLDPESVKKLTRLVYLSQRMEKLVNDLLYFSRLGRQDLAIQSTDMNSVIHDVDNTLDVFLADHHARIIVPTPLPTVTCDKPRVTEAFRNLITNAVKYNDKPEKIVEIGFLDTKMHSKGTLYKNVFYVKDNGRGIASEFYEEIFRIFKRLQNNKNGAEEEGTGAGLTFVKKIVERHGGKIWLESVPGQETTFYFTLEENHHEPSA